MQPFTTLTAKAVPLRRANLDTDQIIPARFLRKPRSAGYDNFLFHDLRHRDDGAPDPDFILNDPHYGDAQVLVTDRNFGTGSSREGAVYALVDAGFRCVIAPSFGDIFAGNASKNGLLAVPLPQDDVAALWRYLEAAPGAVLSVDLPNQTVAAGDMVFAFEIDPFRKHCLVNALDDIELTLAHEAAIDAYERALAAERPWALPQA